MENYDIFAQVYDDFMDNVPYDKCLEYIQQVWQKFNHHPKLICDLACGTGIITNKLAKKGYDMIGIDLSDKMLNKANLKAKKENLNVLYLNQDMREFELYGTVDCILCLCDSINYILEDDELIDVFKLVDNYLDPNGLFIFDINSFYKLETVLGDNSFCEAREDAAFCCENTYYPDEKINEFYTNFFIKDNNTYNRYEEYHYQRAYTIDEITSYLNKANLKLLGVYDYLTFEPPTPKSEKIFFIAQEQTKSKP